MDVDVVSRNYCNVKIIQANFRRLVLQYGVISTRAIGAATKQKFATCVALRPYTRSSCEEIDAFGLSVSMNVQR